MTTAQANTILDTMQTILASAGFTLVTRRKLDIMQVSAQQFPAVVITAGNTSASAASLNNRLTEFAMRVTLTLHVVATTGVPGYAAWNNGIEKILITLTENRTLSGQAVSVWTGEANFDPSVFEPFASGTLNLTIRYRMQLTQGG